jgi:hypothetical protein
MESRAKDGSRGSLKKRHLTIAGLITVLLQYGVGVRNEKTTVDTLRLVARQEISGVQKQVSAIREERERDFVRKDDLSKTLESMDRKLDRMDENMGRVSVKISRVEGFLRAKNRDWFGRSNQNRTEKVSW